MVVKSSQHKVCNRDEQSSNPSKPRSIWFPPHCFSSLSCNHEYLALKRTPFQLPSLGVQQFYSVVSATNVTAEIRSLCTIPTDSYGVKPTNIKGASSDGRQHFLRLITTFPHNAPSAESTIQWSLQERSIVLNESIVA